MTFIFLCLFMLLPSYMHSMYGMRADEFELNGKIAHVLRIKTETETTYFVDLEDGLCLKMRFEHSSPEQFLYLREDHSLLGQESFFANVHKELLEDLFPAYKKISHVKFAWELPFHRLAMLADATYIKEHPEEPPYFQSVYKFVKTGGEWDWLVLRYKKR